MKNKKWLKTICHIMDCKEKNDLRNKSYEIFLKQVWSLLSA